jgi:deoxyribodipyrimidine photolyase
MNATMETKMVDRAQNLTTTLQQKGVDVTSLNAALSKAQTAIQNADTTAFKDAMKEFNQDIQAGIKNGSIDKSVLPQPKQRPASAAGTHPFASTKSHVNSTGSAKSA